MNELSLHPITTIDELVGIYRDLDPTDIHGGLNLDFDFNLRTSSNKTCPFMQLARPTEADAIANLFLHTYKGTYPYREMQKAEEVQKMINDPNYQWILFKTEPNTIVGCVGAHLEPENKKGYHFGFITNPKYQGSVDTVKAFAGSLIYLWKELKNKILVWHSETRTAHSIGQYGQYLLGLIPVAFFPNKDTFFNKAESDFFHINYDKNTLSGYRSKEVPELLLRSQLAASYTYTTNIYNLGTPKFKNVFFDIKPINKGFDRNIVKDSIGNEEIILSIKGSESFMKFHHNTYTRSIEKTEYEVSDHNELNALIQEVKNLIETLKVRYFECFVSAYKPIDQRIFYDSKLKVGGYIPCWCYKEKSNLFEDNLVFIWSKEKVDENIKLIPKTTELLEALHFLPGQEEEDFEDIIAEAETQV